jgi:hypothetical protein
MSHGTGRFSRWVNRVLDADERYICATCDDRFPGRTEGVVHVAACHPEVSTVLAS